MRLSTKTFLAALTLAAAPALAQQPAPAGDAKRAQQKIAMTAPVTQSRGEKIAMTAPVSQLVADGRAFLVAFTLPSTYTLATAPKPLDPTIQIREVPAQVIACWRYSGRWTVENYRQNETQCFANGSRPAAWSRAATRPSPATILPSHPGSCAATKC